MVQSALHDSKEIRLALCERSPERGGIDGVWWPATADLRKELPDLTAVLGLSIGPVRRVLYDPATWPHAPSRILRGGAMVSVDPYAMVASDTVYLMGSHQRDAVLFVLTPPCDAAVARRVLGAVADATRPLDVGILRLLLDGVVTEVRG